MALSRRHSSHGALELCSTIPVGPSLDESTWRSAKSQRACNSVPIVLWENLVSDKTLNQNDKEAWRDFLLQEVVDYLQTNKDEIIGRYVDGGQFKLTLAEIEEFQLMDFDVSITLHCDKRSSFGLGFGFFKANIIR